MSLMYRQPARQERYIVEIYRPPSHYGDPAAWPIDKLGPFPTRGDYDYLDAVESVDANGTRSYLEPTEDYLSTVIQMARVLTEMPGWEVEERIGKQDKDERQFKYNVLLEQVKRATDPCFSPRQVALDSMAAYEGKSNLVTI
jgi:hypothetical protein